MDHKRDIGLPPLARVMGVGRQQQVSYTTSDQHKDVSKARQERDMADTLEVLEYQTPRSPFGGNSMLHSIASGITVDATVNCNCT